MENYGGDRHGVPRIHAAHHDAKHGVVKVELDDALQAPVARFQVSSDGCHQERFLAANFEVSSLLIFGVVTSRHAGVVLDPNLGAPQLQRGAFHSVDSIKATALLLSAARVPLRKPAWIPFFRTIKFGTCWGGSI